MKTNAERRQAKIEKRKQIEREMRQIVLESNREILYDNIRRRRRREFSKGDSVTIVEWIAGRYGKDEEAERLYRVTEGTVLAVLPAGYFVEGRTARGKTARDFINRAQLINGTVDRAKTTSFTKGETKKLPPETAHSDTNAPKTDAIAERIGLRGRLEIADAILSIR